MQMNGLAMQGKVALVTGGNSGIGRGIAHRFAAEGARIAFCGRDSSKGDTVLRELREVGAEGEFYPVDLVDEPAVQDFVDAVAEQFGGIDVVVNNAGAGSRRADVRDDDSPRERWDKLRAPNLDAAYYVCSHALPWLARRGGGSIVNISSTATWHGNWGIYGIAKAGTEGLTRAFAAEGAPHRIRVNCVSPGWIATGNDAFLPASGESEWTTPPSLMNRMGTPAEIAAAVLFLASGEASFITGQTLIVDGGLMITDYPSVPLLESVGDRLTSRGGG